ncbi:hypothetical protein B0H19DRAFT_1366263 [Mycena capillaripes]|nr:hypothetical protein B0H19DRAFT_1366263 [Mycena capillaripes]
MSSPLSTFTFVKKLQMFTDHYAAELGDSVFKGDELNSSEMATKILRLPTHKACLFVGIDHWDAPLLESMIAGDSPATIESKLRELGNFLAALSIPGAKSVTKLLVAGHLPFFALAESPDRSVKNISLLPELDGAFGLDFHQRSNLFSVLCYNRGITIDANEVGLAHRLGRFSPPPVTSDDSPPPSMHSFNVVLDYAAKTFGLEAQYSFTGIVAHFRGALNKARQMQLFTSLHTRRRMPS